MPNRECLHASSEPSGPELYSAPDQIRRLRRFGDTSNAAINGAWQAVEQHIGGHCRRPDYILVKFLNDRCVAFLIVRKDPFLAQPVLRILAYPKRLCPPLLLCPVAEGVKQTVVRPPFLGGSPRSRGRVSLVQFSRLRRT